MRSFCFALTVLGCLGIGAWLVVESHPWFGLLIVLIGSSVRFTSDDGGEA